MEEGYFFEPWARRLEELLVPRLGLRKEAMAPRLAGRRAGTEAKAPPPRAGGAAGPGGEVAAAVAAELDSCVFLGGRAAGDFEVPGAASPARRLRSLLVRDGPRLQAFNAVLYPSYSLGLLPVLGVDVLSFNQHQRLLFGVDWAPMLPGVEYAEAHVSPYLGEFRQRHHALLLEPSGKFYGDAPEFFSPQIFFSRPQTPEAFQPGSELWMVFEEYCTRYCDVLEAAASAAAAAAAFGPRLSADTTAELAKERQCAYDVWHAERDPALPIFRKLFGGDWTEEFVREVLFPGVAARGHGARACAPVKDAAAVAAR